MLICSGGDDLSRVEGRADGISQSSKAFSPHFAFNGQLPFMGHEDRCDLCMSTCEKVRRIVPLGPGDTRLYESRGEILVSCQKMWFALRLVDRMMDGLVLESHGCRPFSLASASKVGPAKPVPKLVLKSQKRQRRSHHSVCPSFSSSPRPDPQSR